jgi:signal transduction histidine kinase
MEADVYKNAARILIIDDEAVICDSCAQVFSEDGYVVETSLEGSTGLRKIDNFKPDIIFIDLKMPGINGMEVLEKVIEKDTNIVPVVITGFATIDSAVESMKRGAFDFLPKPFTPEELRIITKRALEKRRVMVEAARLRIEKERMRQNFISLVAHELRTPLAAVTQLLEVFASGSVGVVSQEQTRIIGRMKIRLRELILLIDRWLKLTRIEESKLKEGFSDFRLATVIEDAADLVKPLAQERNVRVDIDITNRDILVHGDEEMVKEVFVNLLSNGIKYNHAGGIVKVTPREKNDYWIIDVRDTGIGIAEQDIIHMGEEFYRVKREGSTAGSGLGLAIVKKILDIHDGRLEIHSELDQGSTFSIYLPLTSTETRTDS